MVATATARVGALWTAAGETDASGDDAEKVRPGSDKAVWMLPRTVEEEVARTTAACTPPATNSRRDARWRRLEEEGERVAVQAEELEADAAERMEEQTAVEKAAIWVWERLE